MEVFDSRRVGQLKSHGKIMLVDEAKVVVGSLALAALSLDFMGPSRSARPSRPPS